MTVSGRGRSDTLWTLKPGHSDWVKSVQISEDFSFGSSSSEDDNFGACQYSRMCISGCWGRSGDFGFSELVGIDIKNVGIIEVGIALGFACKVVPSKDDDGGS